MDNIILQVVLLLLVTISRPVTSSNCGQLDSCDRLISYSIFQKGACGRAARCYWELIHLERTLLGNTSNVVTYESKIRDALCNIPTLRAYKNVRDGNDEILERYNVCGKWENDTSTEFDFYPMTTFYTYRHPSGTNMYLKRMAACAVEEHACSVKLQDKIDDLCDMLDMPFLKRLEDSFKMKIRHQNFYEVAVLHPEILLEQEGIKDVQNYLSQTYRKFNNCSLLQFRRKRVEDAVDGDATFIDEHGFNWVDYRMRGPYFDLYILYEADPYGMFGNIPLADRWWNETKAYQEVAHYLPTDMINSIHDAIKCVYDSINAKELVWHPEKFCWGYSTFICVELTPPKWKGTVCSATDRHNSDSDPVTAYVSPSPSPSPSG